MSVSGMLDDLLQRVTSTLPPEELAKLRGQAASEMAVRRFVPNPGPQTLAWYSPADELFFGGSAGPGKTALLCGLPVCEHHDIQLFRREGTQLRGLVKELTKIIGSTLGFNSQLGIWRLDGGKTIELAGIKDEDDKEKWQGREADFKGFDEITHFSRSQYRFIVGWNRSTRPGQRCRVIAAGNPPLTAQGLWVIKEWAAWLDPTHPDPAKPGELRWPVRASDDEDGDDPTEIFFRTKEEAMAYMATLRSAPKDERGNIIPPRSRTFIAGSLEDNPDLMRTGYSAVIEAMPKEVREALRGSFAGSMTDQDFQVIPSEWIRLAQARWKPDGWKEHLMTAMAYDPAGGGGDAAELAFRHNGWFGEIVTRRGKETADGSQSAALIVQHRRDGAPVVVDAGGGAGNGFGGTTIMRLTDNDIPTVAFNGAAEAKGRTRDGRLEFYNERAAAMWKLREDLDPDQQGGSIIALPPDPEILSDLSAATYEITARGIKVEDKKDIRKRLGRSPGKGDVVMMCWSAGQRAVKREMQRREALRHHGQLAQSVNPNRSRFHKRRGGGDETTPSEQG
jgi:hypothetical protein